MVEVLFVANVCVGHAVVVGCCHVVQRCVHFSDIPGRSVLGDILVYKQPRPISDLFVFGIFKLWLIQNFNHNYK